MIELSSADVTALGRAAALEIADSDAQDVAEVLSAVIELVDEINPAGLDTVEPLPLLPARANAGTREAVTRQDPPEHVASLPESEELSEDLSFRSVAELSLQIQAKQVSPVELVRCYLDRIDRIDGKLHSYITVCREEAMRAARHAEQEVMRGTYRGPLHGIPIAHKDQWWTRGVRTTAALSPLAKIRADRSVGRLHIAGSRACGRAKGG